MLFDTGIDFLKSARHEPPPVSILSGCADRSANRLHCKVKEHTADGDVLAELPGQVGTALATQVDRLTRFVEDQLLVPCVHFLFQTRQRSPQKLATRHHGTY